MIEDNSNKSNKYNSKEFFFPVLVSFLIDISEKALLWYNDFNKSINTKPMNFSSNIKVSFKYSRPSDLPFLGEGLK